VDVGGIAQQTSVSETSGPVDGACRAIAVSPFVE
jgi:hypothetical protein